MHDGALACDDFRGKSLPSFYFWLTAQEKNLKPAQNAKIRCNLIEV